MIRMYGICHTIAVFAILTIVALSAAPITGGAKPAFAAQERFIYEVVIMNNASKVTTTMRVYAYNEHDAKENVAANGWSVLSVKQLNFKLENPVAVDSGSAPIQYLTIDNASNIPVIIAGAENTQAFIDSILGNATDNNDSYDGPPHSSLAYTQSGGGAVATGGTGTPSGNAGSNGLPANGGSADNNGLPAGGGYAGAEVAVSGGEGAEQSGRVNGSTLPAINDLTYIYTFYFDLGEITPQRSTRDAEAIMSKISRDSKIYVFGNTDTVRVGENADYEDNLELSFKRAENIKAILIGMGVYQDNITTVGLGYLYPVSPNVPGGNVKNRRVDVYELK